jgi:hypothetical protein
LRLAAPIWPGAADDDVAASVVAIALVPAGPEQDDQDPGSRRITPGSSFAPIVSEHVIPDADRRRLELYNEQAEVLLGSRFAAVMFGQMTGVTLSWEEGGPLEATVKGPDDEAVRAFTLTFRMLFRNGDGISFREIAEIYDAASVPAALREDCRWAREAMNQFLDGPTMFEVNQERITRRRLVEVFLYGGIAHMNPEKRKAYELWRGNPVLFAMMENEFALATCGSCVSSTSPCCGAMNR